MARPHRILIVDDEEPLRVSLARAARAEGYRVDTAVGGAQALVFLSRRHYDLVVTDLKMPGIDGPQLMGRIVEEEISTRVIVVTGYATLEAAVDCLRKGAVDFLVKPFEVETFLASLERAMGRALPVGPDGLDWGSLEANYGLSRRQREILQLLHTTSMNNREVAEHLCLSYHTVKSHLKAAYQKLGITSRTQLFQKLREGG